MNARFALAFAGAAAIAAALDGAARTLTAAPPVLTLCAGMALVIVALTSSSWRTLALVAATGACAGLWLSYAAPPDPRAVSERAPRDHAAGDLFDALDAIDANPSAFDGRTIAVRGTWTPARAGGAATVSRRVMSCCVADAVDVGFDVASRGSVQARSGAWVRVAGVVRARMHDGEIRYEIDRAEVRPVAHHDE